MQKIRGAQRMWMERRIIHQDRKWRLLTLVQERLAKKRCLEAPYFHADVMIQVFILLPVKYLIRLSCVCKSWKQIIHSSDFVEAYNSHAQPVLVFLRSEKRVKPNQFHLETQVRQTENFSFFPEVPESSRNPSIHLLKIQDGNKGQIIDLNISTSRCSDILAAAYGLILFKTRGKHLSVKKRGKPQRYVVMNPMTRKFRAFPLGTIAFTSSRRANVIIEASHGIICSPCDGMYKVVHLFYESEDSIGCEVLDLRTKTWKAINGPLIEDFTRSAYAPVSAFGGLHWLTISGSEKMVSLDADDEIFYRRDLPSASGPSARLVQMGDYLSFVSIGVHQMDVWVLKELHQTEWTRQHTIDIDPSLNSLAYSERLVPLLIIEGKQIVFQRTGRMIYTYDFTIGLISEVEMEDDSTSVRKVIPHVNSLATWEPLDTLS